MARGAGGRDRGLRGAAAELAGVVPGRPGGAVAGGEAGAGAAAESLFVFPPWLAVGAPLFVGALTMLAAAYPARRAARLNPVARLDRPRGRETMARMTYPSVDKSFE